MAKKYLKSIALILFIEYILWNIIWISNGCIPPSLFYYFTGYPCPTTGCTRSLLFLLGGEVKKSLLYNPLTLIYILLLLLSGFFVIRNVQINKKVFIPHYMVSLWLIALLFGWVAKFVIGTKYW